MNDNRIPAAAADDDAELTQALHDLGQVTAPPRLLSAVMAGTALGDAYAPVETVLGPALIAYTADGISAVSMETAEAFERRHLTRTGRRARPIDMLPASLERAVTAHLTGVPRPPRLHFDLRGLHDFETSVLRAALTIPHGEVRPYGWVARVIGHPGAARAVGTALGHNPIPLLIPCHRVVRSDGFVGHYALGPDAKRSVLRGEGLDPDALDDLAAHGVRFIGSDTTHIFCFPTCRHARRIDARHQVRLRSAEAALARGFRPCRVCQPIADVRPQGTGIASPAGDIAG